MSGKKKLSETEIDELALAQADDESAWGKPVRVRPPKVAPFSLSAELAARAAFFARLHHAANVEAWLERVVQERLELEEAALAELKRERIAKKTAGRAASFRRQLAAQCSRSTSNQSTGGA